MTLERQIFDWAAARTVPIFVQLHLTHRCHLGCGHCYRVVEPLPELETCEIKDILEQLAEAGTLQVTFSGGEPLLRRDFLEVAGYARQMRMAVLLYTTATTLTPALADALAAIGFLEVHVSIYSDDPVVHDGITGVSGSHAQSVAGVRLLRERSVPVRLKCSVMRDNLASFRGVVALAAGLGCRYQFDPELIPRTDGDRAPLERSLSPEELERYHLDPVAQRAEREGCCGEEREWTGARIAPGNSGNGGYGKVDASSREYDEALCGAGRASCSISPYGEVTPCVALPLSGGNVRRQRFSDIWRESEAFLAIRAIAWRDLGSCRGGVPAAMSGRCPAQVYREDPTSLRAP